MITTDTPVLAAADLDRLTASMALLGANDTHSALAAAVPSLDIEQRAAVTRHATLDHVALLIFPETLTGLADELARHGIEVGTMTPSVATACRSTLTSCAPGAAEPCPSAWSHHETRQNGWPAGSR